MSVPELQVQAVAPPAPAAPVVLPERCANCGNGVSQRFCGACGQKLDAPLHSLWHFARHATEDLTHADSRLWRTLAALVFKPGHLTREFWRGRRARYLPPLRLYLVLSVVFFVWATATRDPQLGVLRLDSEHPENSSVAIENPAETTELRARAGETPEQRAERLCKDSDYNGPWEKQLKPLIPRVCRRTVADGGHALAEAFLHNVPRAMFVFLPLLAAAMMLMYWFPRHYYVEHLLLFVHNHACVFLVAVLAGIARALLPGLGRWLSFAVVGYFAWYMYRSMRVVYAQGRLLTLGKLALLALIYLFAGALTLALTTVYSALSL